MGAGNKAGTDGGWAFCRGCRVLHTTACTLQGNTARGMGGAVACQDCHSVDAASVSFSSNHAGNGGAVAVASSNYAKGACSVRMSACTFDINTAEPSRDPITSAVLSASQGLSHQLLGCDQEWQGLGGAACIAVAGEAWMSNNTFRGNSADFGGACRTVLRVGLLLCVGCLPPNAALLLCCRRNVPAVNMLPTSGMPGHPG